MCIRDSISDDSLVISGTKSNPNNQTVRDLYAEGDLDSDGSIGLEEFLRMAEEIEPGD